MPKDIFACMEHVYNRQRIHSDLGFNTPVKYGEHKM